MAALTLAQTAYAVSATGGDIITNYALNGTNYRAHIFTTVGATGFTVVAGGNVEVLVVAGGGGGGQTIGGGGGAGGFTNAAYFVEAGSNYAVIVGAGGAGAQANVGTYATDGGARGSNSLFDCLTAFGGGGGGSYNQTVNGASAGGSGGGMGAGNSGGPMAGTNGQGNAGGTTAANSNYGAGGGAAGTPGTNGVPGGPAGAGGAGKSSDFSGIVTDYAGGGGGGARNAGVAGMGGIGGGGDGSTNDGANATANTGGGGGGGGYLNSPVTCYRGGDGGCGIVIVRYDATTPFVVNAAATNVTDATADLVGNLTSTGIAETTVWAFWDTTDRTTNKTWTHSTNFVASSLGVFTNPVSGLLSNQTYFFAYYASNTDGEVWAQPSLPFKTWGPPAVDNDGGAASIGYTFATLRGTLLDGNAAYATIMWGTNQASLASTSTPVWVAEGTFSVAVTGLVDNTTYYYQCFVSNAYGTATAAATTNFTTPNSVGSRYVATDGPVDGDGSSWVMAFTNIQAAIDAAAPSGDTIYIRQGTYSITSQLVVANKNLAIQGGYDGTTPLPGGMIANPSLTVVDAQQSSRVIYIGSANGVVLSNLTFSGGYLLGSGSIGGAGLYTLDSALSVVDCVIRDNQHRQGHNQPAKGGGIYINGGTSVFERCEFLRNTQPRNDDWSYGGAVYHNAGDLELRSCLLAGNWGDQSAGTAGYGGVIYAKSAGSLRLYNCLVRDNFVGFTADTSSEAITCAGAGMVSIENCTVAGNYPRGINRRAGTVIVTNSIVWDNGDDLVGSIDLNYSCVSDTNEGAGVTHADPQFEEGYYLADGSPCANAGGDSATNVGLAGLYAQTNTADTHASVDLGYHHVAALSVTNIYVSPDGDDETGTGEEGTPYRSVTRALAAAPPQARIRIEAGTYATNCESFPLLLKTEGVQLLGTNAEATVINAAGSNQRVVTVNGVSRWAAFSNLTFQGGYSAINGGGGGGLYLQGTGVRLYDCIIRTNRVIAPHNGAAYGSGVWIKDAAPWFERCDFSTNIGTGSDGVHYGGGVYQLYGSSMFSGCRFIGNTSTGNGRGGAGLYGAGYGRMRLYNCLIVTNITIGGYAGGIHAAAGMLVALDNCTLAGNNGMGLYGVSGSSVEVTNSILWTNGVDVTGTVNLDHCDIQVVSGTNVTTTDCISADPLFVNPDNGDYRLQTAFYRWSVEASNWVHELATSPCVDTGTNQAWMVSATDLDGMPRIAQGYPPPATVDMGAYEATKPDPATAPVLVLNQDATNFTDTTADLVCDLVATGGAPTTVWAFWDTTDRTTNKTWAHSTNFAAGRLGYFTNTVTELTPNQTNYFAYYASNVSGAAWWAQPSLSFQTWGLPSADYDGGPTEIWNTNATLRGTLLSMNGAYVTAMWGTDQFALSSTGAMTWVTNGIFAFPINGLVSNTTYYYQYFVSNDYGTVTTEITNFTTKFMWGTWYVATNGPAGGDGKSWAMAFTNIQQALNEARDDHQILLAGHTFGVTSELRWSNMIDVIIKGGWEGTGAPLGSNNPVLWPTVVRRDPAVSDIRIFRIVSVTGTLAQMTIRDGSGWVGLKGGGVLVNDSTLTFDGCLVISNVINGVGWEYMYMYGAGINATASDISITNCAFTGNRIYGGWRRGNNQGGACYFNGGSAVIASSRFINNKSSGGGNPSIPDFSSYGGAIYANCPLTINDSVFLDNTATSGGGPCAGGAVYVNGLVSARRSVFSGGLANSVDRMACGGGIYAVNGTELHNVLVANNAAFSNSLDSARSGAGVYLYAGSLLAEAVTVAGNTGEGIHIRQVSNLGVSNSIFWGNMDDLSGFPTNGEGVLTNVFYCDIGDGDNNGTNGCISVDPLFADTNYFHLQGKAGTYTGGYFSGGDWGIAMSNSPCLDVGDPARDYSLEPAFDGRRINLGAYANTPVASKSIRISGILIRVR